MAIEMLPVSVRLPAKAQNLILEQHGLSAKPVDMDIPLRHLAKILI